MNCAAFHPLRTAVANELIGLDIIGPSSVTSTDNKYLVLLVDYFTTWCEAFPLKIIDPHGSQFCRGEMGMSGGMYPPINCIPIRGQILKTFCLMRCVIPSDLIKSTVSHHPQGNSLVERTTRKLISLLRRSLKKRMIGMVSCPVICLTIAA